MKNIVLLFLSTILFYIQDTHSSELMNPQIPTIDIIQLAESNNSGILYMPIKNNAFSEDEWKIHLFSIAIEKKICPSALDHTGSGSERNIAINIGQAIAIFKNTIDANKDIYFKDCPFLYEVLFPSKNQSPIKNVNHNGSPRPSSPRASRRESGSGTTFYNRFSTDPNLQEQPRECILKNAEQKKLFINIIAYCILNLNPQIVDELYEKITQSSQVNRIESKNTSDAYNFLQKKYTALENDYNKNLTYINELKSRIKELESAVEPIDQNSEENNSVINNLHEQIDQLKKQLQNTVEKNNAYLNESRKKEKLVEELNQNKDCLSIYRLISGISCSTTIILLICLLYKNDLLSTYYANMLH